LNARKRLQEPGGRSTLRFIWQLVPDLFSTRVLQKVYVIGQLAFQTIPGSVDCDSNMSAECAQSFENLRKSEQFDRSVGVAFNGNIEKSCLTGLLAANSCCRLRIRRSAKSLEPRHRSCDSVHASGGTTLN
jgi:hypothetical protein